jgi:hypothetical protein
VNFTYFVREIDDFTYPEIEKIVVVTNNLNIVELAFAKRLRWSRSNLTDGSTRISENASRTAISHPEKVRGKMPETSSADRSLATLQRQP